MTATIHRLPIADDGLILARCVLMDPRSSAVADMLARKIVARHEPDSHLLELPDPQSEQYLMRNVALRSPVDLPPILTRAHANRAWDIAAKAVIIAACVGALITALVIHVQYRVKVEAAHAETMRGM